MQTIKVLVVDGSPVFLRAATLMLSALPQVQVVGSVLSAEAALAAAQAEPPDLILIDSDMPGPDGLHTAVRLRTAGVAAKIVLVSPAPAQEVRVREHNFVCNGFISKSHFAADIQQIIEHLFTRDASRGGGR